MPFSNNGEYYRVYKHIINKYYTMQTIIKTIPSGSIPGDQAVEIFGDRKSKQVYFFQNGKTLDFKELHPAYKRQLLERLLEDPVAMKQLGHLGYTKALKRFAFCHYGSLDNIPDFCKDGKLGPSDNFRCSDNCTCLNWKSKNITADKDVSITHKQLQIIDLLYEGYPDKAIADKLNVALSTVNNHKTAIMKKLNAQSKVDIITKAINLNIIQ